MSERFVKKKIPNLNDVSELLGTMYEWENQWGTYLKLMDVDEHVNILVKPKKGTGKWVFSLQKKKWFTKHKQGKNGLPYPILISYNRSFSNKIGNKRAPEGWSSPDMTVSEGVLCFIQAEKQNYKYEQIIVTFAEYLEVDDDQGTYRSGQHSFPLTNVKSGHTASNHVIFFKSSKWNDAQKKTFHSFMHE